MLDNFTGIGNDTLVNLGERKLIDLIRKKARERGVDHPGLYPGDDATVYSVVDGYTVLTTDSICFETHIPPGTKPWFAGWYLSAVNLSDLAAMAATPIGLLLSISAPGTAKVSWLEDFVDGFCACLEQHGAALLGGDTKEGPGVFTATAIGLIKGRNTTPRSGVKPRDLIAITGTVGLRASLLKLGKTDEALHITPRVEEAIAAADMGATAAMDTSDSLSLALYNLAESSCVRIDVNASNIPLDPLVPKAFGELDDGMALGGDYDLAISFSPEKLGDMETAFTKAGTRFTVIGQASAGEGVWIAKEGETPSPLEKMGYEHFGRRK